MCMRCEGYVYQVLRPLRAIKRIQALKLCIETLFAGLPEMLNVGFLVGFLFLIFAIAGIVLSLSLSLSLFRFLSRSIHIYYIHGGGETGITSTRVQILTQKY